MSTSLFMLRPALDGLTDPAWGLSWHRNPCQIHARSAEEARRVAAGQYTVAVHPDPLLAAWHSPWLDTRLVAVDLMAAVHAP
ncbi:hypothetical protein JMJ56_14280 [Belnapia sp. T18]|uniref:Uncharacterized protein n=1 Tax=Belnapia arida TaxID=2804533 RepID=A0ABS1U3D9_9PROT|nr:hypothetical protein [Belnapia arida]MBL6079182.1 hypothetical protein [Belnapia arida]